MNIPLYNEQIDLLYQIASWRSPLLDVVFRFISYFDTIFFFMLLIPFVWIGLSYRWGIRLAFLSISNVLINLHLKYLFDLPRPFSDLPDMAMIHLPSPGLPSGAAQQAMLLSILLIATWKSRWSYLVASIGILLISFSRLYLGVHYPIDLLAGWIVGLILGIAFLKIIDPLEEFFYKEGRALALVICATICFLYIYLLPIPIIYQLMGSWLGFGIGAYIGLEHKLYAPSSKELESRIYRGIAAVTSLVLIFFLIRHQAPPFVLSLIGALWISLGSVFLCRALFPLPQKSRKHRRS